jgi:hypothetical protein
VLTPLPRLSCCFCLCSQAEGSWSKQRCCAVRGNYCADYTACTDRTSSSDYLYRLSPGDPERYAPIPGGNADYQYVSPTSCTNFGDLRIGYDGPPGTHGLCNQGHTYRGSTNAACGGDGNWDHTDLEVWFI